MIVVPTRPLRAVTAGDVTVVAELEVAGGEVAAICVTSQVNTHVFVDRALEVLHSAIVWQDGRAAAAIWAAKAWRALPWGLLVT